MHLFFLATFAFGLVSAVAVNKKANYDGFQVVRLEVGDHLAQVKALIETLGLSTWNGGPKADSTVDVVVPPAAVKTFEDSTAGTFIECNF